MHVLDETSLDFDEVEFQVPRCHMIKTREKNVLGNNTHCLGVIDGLDGELKVDSMNVLHRTVRRKFIDMDQGRWAFQVSVNNLTGEIGATHRKQSCYIQKR